MPPFDPPGPDLDPLRPVEDVLPGVLARGRRLRRRRRLAMVTPIVAALAVLTATAFALQGDGPSRRLTATRGVHTTTTTEPPSTTSEPPSTTAAPAAVAPTSSTASPAPLRITLAVLDPRPRVDTNVRVRVTATDGDGSLTALSVGYTRLVDAGPFPTCGQPGPSQFSKDLDVPISLLDVAREPGGHYVAREATPVAINIVATATSRSGCTAEETATSATPGTLGYGNGPALPGQVDILLGSQEIQFGACDSDGILGAVDIDWGDGSPHGTVTGNRYGCGYPGPVGGATHTYPGPGTYTITAVATSVDDQGQAAQHSQPTSTDVKVNADGTYGAG